MKKILILISLLFLFSCTEKDIENAVNQSQPTLPQEVKEAILSRMTGTWRHTRPTEYISLKLNSQRVIVQELRLKNDSLVDYMGYGNVTPVTVSTLSAKNTLTLEVEYFDFEFISDNELEICVNGKPETCLIYLRMPFI